MLFFLILHKIYILHLIFHVNIILQKKFWNFSMPILVSCVSQMLNALRKIYLHVYGPLRLILDLDSLSSRKKKKSEITNKPIEPTQLEKALKAVRDGHMTVRLNLFRIRTKFRINLFRIDIGIILSFRELRNFVRITSFRTKVVPD